ncbi:AAA family ATPase [Enterococcus sp.]|uniref:AAA family ATPase n=1 Tax=Enterococcus sp. TaxID=35783 RepID=UPI003C77ED7F
MFYYELTLSSRIAEEENEEDLDFGFRKRREKNEFVEKCWNATDICLADQNRLGGIFFVKEMYEQYIFAVILADNRQLEGLIADYFSLVELAIDSLTMKECTLQELSVMLKKIVNVDRIGYRQEIINHFGLEAMFGSLYVPICKDFLVTPTATNDELLTKIDYEYFSPAFSAEAQRIFLGGGEPDVLYHPVHYVIKSQSQTLRDQFLDTLLACLKNQQRILSSRYTLLSLKNLQSIFGFNKEVLHSVYATSIGGTVVLDLGTVTDLRSQPWIESLHKVLLRYHNQVLTIFVVGEGKKIEVPLLKTFADMQLVVLQQEPALKKQVAAFVEYSCHYDGLVANQHLWDALGDTTSYCPQEVYEIYGKWKDQFTRATYFPQYEQLRLEATVEKNVSVGDAYEELQGLIGLTQVKQLIHQTIAYYQMQHLLKSRGLQTSIPAMHMVFTGNPGTAKTTVARLFGQIMKESGILEIGDLIEVGRSDLVGRFVGSTAPLVKTAFQRAKGCVLFIDEAYSLADGQSNSFGQEAIDTLVQEMENHRQEVIVIFAGYPDQMAHFIAQNPGLKSRITHQITFEDYQTEELVAIAQQIAQKKGLYLAKEVLTKLADILLHVKKADGKNFGNGRTVRNLVEKATIHQAERLMANKPHQLTDEELVTLVAEDFTLPPAPSSPSTCKIGFLAS